MSETLRTEKHSSQREVKRLLLIALGSALMAVNLNTFVRAGNLIPAGFTGLTVLVQEVFMRFGGVSVPFSPVLFAINAIPAIICFRVVGKKFTLRSVLVVILTGLMTDFMPEMFISFIKLYDPLLSAVFGGILTALACILCLNADATAGGTDFIAITISEKYNKNAWNTIFAGNCVMLVIAGVLFSLEVALYSIIFQFVVTAGLNSLYKAYQQQTMLIVTNCPQEVYHFIQEKTHHAATSLSGTGLYGKTERTVLYSVVYANEVTPLIQGIRTIDSNAFINVIKTEQLNGKFFRAPKD